VETVASTVRFGGDLKRFLNAQADTMGITVPGFITAVLTGVMNETLGRRSQVDMVPRRILEVFELHGIDLVTAAEILDIPFADMTPERLADHVNNPMLDRLCNTFPVNREWILGRSSIAGRSEISC
jgi:hypothetical protein